MGSAKKDVLDIVDKLPDDVGLQEIVQQIYRLLQIRRELAGRADAAPPESIETQALSLPLEARELLASRLLHSLDEPSETEIEESWIEEAERRYADLKSGRVQGIPEDEAMARIRANLGW